MQKTMRKPSVRATRTARDTARSIQQSAPAFDLARSIEYFGVVNYTTTERVLEEMRALMRADAASPITLSVTSAGGPSGTALSFYDHVRLVLKPHLITIGAGDVDSSGVIIFLSGDTRYVTPNTTMLLHEAGRTFEGGKRLTAAELDAMIREDRLKDFQYASVVAERSRGRLTTEKVLEFMKSSTILTPTDMLAYGIADSILS